MKNLVYLTLIVFAFSFNTYAQENKKDVNKKISVIKVNGALNENLTINDFFRKDSRLKNYNVLFYPGNKRYQSRITPPKGHIYGAYRIFFQAPMNMTEKRLNSFKNNPELDLAYVPISGNSFTYKFFIEGESALSSNFKNLSDLKMRDIKNIILVNNTFEKKIYIELMDYSKEKFIKSEFLKNISNTAP